MSRPYKEFEEPKESLFRIQRALASYVSLAAACGVNEPLTEYSLYEHIFRVLMTRGYTVQCEFRCPGFKRNKGGGDHKRIDFEATKPGVHFALEVKWHRPGNPTKSINVRRDYDKLVAFKQENKTSRSFLCIFGRTTDIEEVKVLPNAFSDLLTFIKADFRRTRFGCRMLELEQRRDTGVFLKSRDTERRRLAPKMRDLSISAEPLSEAEIERFLTRHIPYRLELLRLGIAAAPASSLTDSAAVEAAIIAGRQLIQFLGLGIKFSPNEERPTLEQKIKYHRYKKDGIACTDEVKVVNVGGEFLKLSRLKEEDKRILAEFLYGASKATAHLTEGSNHKLNDNGGEVFLRGCELILELVSNALLTLK